MAKRFAAIWFRHLMTDWKTRRQPELYGIPFVIATPERGRMVVKAVSRAAEKAGIGTGMVVADCRTIFPSLIVLDTIEITESDLLQLIAEWSLRYTPTVAVDLPDGLILDISGCAHLWGGEHQYLNDIITKFHKLGYDATAAIADTIGAAWAISRYGHTPSIIEPGGQVDALYPLPPASLRLEPHTLQRLNKLGLYRISSFIKMPRSALSRRFGQALLSRLDQAFGQEAEFINPIRPAQPYQERLPSLEPVRTAPGIEIALKTLLETICKRLAKEGKGLRTSTFKGYRIDGNIQQIEIGTNRPSRDIEHLYKLFEIKIPDLPPDLGFELFLLEATTVEDISPEQEKLWNTSCNNNDTDIAKLLDRISGKMGKDTIHRYLPNEHYWPERSVKVASSYDEKSPIPWQTNLPRPISLLNRPEAIEVTVPIPDYPPMLFRYKGQLHNITKADGPERIEPEWWIEAGQQRDYYCVEDEQGARYWIFRLGLYGNTEPKWFIHGFFA